MFKEIINTYFLLQMCPIQYYAANSRLKNGTHWQPYCHMSTKTKCHLSQFVNQINTFLVNTRD